MHRVIARSPRWALTLLVVVLAGVATIAVPAIRTPVLRTAGWALVVDDPVEPADMIVVTTDAGGAGVLEAADLVHRGIATRVAVFADPPDDVDREFIRRGVPYEDAAARSIRQLRSLGVTTIEQNPRLVAGTEDEGRVLPGWCDQHRFRSVVVVSQFGSFAASPSSAPSRDGGSPDESDGSIHALLRNSIPTDGGRRAPASERKSSSFRSCCSTSRVTRSREFVAADQTSEA